MNDLSPSTTRLFYQAAIAFFGPTAVEAWRRCRQLCDDGVDTPSLSCVEY